MYGSPRRLDIISCGQAALAAPRRHAGNRLRFAAPALLPDRGELPAPRRARSTPGPQGTNYPCRAVPRCTGTRGTARTAPRPLCTGTRGTACAAPRPLCTGPRRTARAAPRPLCPGPRGTARAAPRPLYSRHAGNCLCRAAPALLPARGELPAPRRARAAPLCAGAGKTGSSARAPGRVKTLSESAAR